MNDNWSSGLRAPRVRTGTLDGAARGGRWRRWGMPMAVGTVAFVARFLMLGAIDNDHFVFTARARQMLHGDWPVRDFADPGMPLGYLLPAAAAAVAGPTLLSDAVLWIGMFAVAAAITFVLARRASDSTEIALACCALMILAAPRLYNASKALVPAGVIAFAWRYADRPTAARIATLGGATAVAFAVRHDYALYAGIATVVLIAVSHRATPRAGLRHLAIYIGATALGILPWMIYVHWAAGIGDYLSAALRFSRSEGRRTMGSSWPVVYYLVAAIPAAALLAARRGAGGLHAAHMTFAATMVLLLDLVFLRDVPAARLPDVVAPSAIVGCLLVGRFVSLPARRSAGIAGLVAMAIASPFVLSGRGHGMPRPADMRDRWSTVTRRLISADPAITPSPARRDLIAYLARCTRPNERVLVFGFGPEIPVLAGRPFAAGHPSMMPGYYEAAEDVRAARARLARERLGAVVMLGSADGFARSWPRLVIDLQRRRLEPHTLVLGDQRVELWLARPAESASIDPATGLPCRRTPR